jgi:hypothetical protein
VIEIGDDRYAFHGHAIVSADDRIADATGRTPPGLRIAADWQRFQAALDRSVLTVLGRLGHEANPNHRGRNRLVLSTQAAGIEHRGDAWWWNPAEVALASALALAAPGGGIVAVPGGRRVFDLFLDVGYDEFHLTRADRVRIGDGVALFSAIGGGVGAEAVLAGRGLAADAPVAIDDGVRVVVWRKP